MNGGDNPNQDEKHSESNGTPHGQADPVPAKGASGSSNDNDKPESHSKTEVRDDPESIAAETLQRVKATEIWMIALTAVIAVASLVTAWVYWHQLDVMQNTLDEIRVSGVDSHALAMASGKTAQANRTIADEAKVSAESSARIARSSEHNVIDAQRAVRLDQRAWISLKYIGGRTETEDTVIEPNKPILFRAVFVNSGRTPGIHARMRGCTATGFSKPKHVKCPPPRDDSEFVLGPGMMHYLGLQLGPLSEEKLTSIHNGALRAWLFVTVQYEDIFGGHHTTEVCNVYDPFANGWVDCEQGGNTAD